MRAHQDTRKLGRASTPQSTKAIGARVLALVVVVAAALFAPQGATAQNYESHVVTIDATTPQPIATGFVPADSTGDVIILSEGNIRVYDSSNRYDRGWFGPNGMTRLQRFGQPISNGMPYGAVVGGFTTMVENYRFVGRLGAFPLDAAYVGQELHISLNMSDADLAAMEGVVKVTVIYVAEGAADRARFLIDDSSTLPIATGLTAVLNDQFVVLPYGMLDTGITVNYTGGFFGPDGLPSFNRLGQPYPEGPYGGLYGYFVDAANGFYVGDGGAWRAGAQAAGLEFHLNLNLDPADLVGSEGGLVVNVIRIPQ